MDFDLIAALNDYQTYMCAPEACRKPDAASTPPQPKLSSGCATDTLTVQSTTYHDLPPEVIQRIGDYVPIQDVVKFSAINRHTYRSMLDRRSVWRYWEQANHTVSLASLNSLLEEMEDALKNPAQRIEPIMALRQRLQALPQAERVDAFKRLFLAADRIPKDGVKIQKAMIATLDDFQEMQRPELFDFAYAIAERHDPEQENFWIELASALDSLPLSSPQFLSSYQALLARLTHLKVSDRAKIIPRLSTLLCSLEAAFGPTDAHVPELYAMLWEQTLWLPESHQGDSVSALAVATRALSGTEQFVRYMEIRNLAMSLPAEQWGVAITGLLIGLENLPLEQRAAEFLLLEPGLKRVLPAQRAHAAISLLTITWSVDDTLAKRLWQRALGLLDGMEEAELVKLVNRLNKIGVAARLSDHKRQLAMVEIRAFMERNRFPEQARARILSNIPWQHNPPLSESWRCTIQ